MTAKQLTEIAVQEDVIDSGGKTPEATIAPQPYLQFKGGQGGTDQGWLTYLANAGRAWAQTQFQDPNMTVTVTGGHQVLNNTCGATQYDRAFN